MAKQNLSPQTKARRKAQRTKPNLALSGREVLEAAVGRFGIPEKTKPIRKTSNITLNFKRHLFSQQLEFINDSSKRKAALCTRRAGKSFAVSRYLIQEAIDKPETLCVYIARTREAAKRILWNMLKQADKQYRLGIRFNNASLIAKFPNGSEIIFTGANDASDVDKLRGAAFSLAVLDEAAFFNIDLKELVRDVLSPALLDSDGTLAMISTPNSQCAGLFYDITELGKFGYSVHKWSIRDNPYMTQAVKSVQRDVRSGILDPTDPSYKREYEGLWVKDDRSIVYKYSDMNIYKELPENCFWEYLMGIDLGYHDPTAFIIAAYSEDHEELFILEQFKQKNMLTSDVEDLIKEFQSRFNFSKIVVDTGGGASRMVLETFRDRTGLAIEPAKKSGDKAGLIKLMNADLARGLIKVKQDSELLEEWDKLQFNLAGTAEDKRFDNHLSDAALYTWMESRHFLYEAKEKPPELGTAEYYRQLEDKIEERLLKEQEEEGGHDEDLWGSGYANADAFFN